MYDKNFIEDQIVRFVKKAQVFDLDNKTEFYVDKNATAKVIFDDDAGNIGSVKIKLNKKDGSSVIVETNHENLKEVK
jgi:hypothetical protein